jgi:hypothetical protein
MFIEASIHQGGHAFKTPEVCFRISKNVLLDHILEEFEFDLNSYPLTICKTNLTIFSTLLVYFSTGTFT